MTSRYLQYSAEHSGRNIERYSKLSGKDFDVSRASDRTSHANHLGPSPAVQKKITPHILTEIFGPPIFNFPPYFLQVADLHFKTFLDTNSTVRHCWRSLRPLKMLPIDSPSNFTLDGMFASHFRKRSLAKIQKIQKNLSGHFPNPSRKKNPE